MFIKGNEQKARGNADPAIILLSLVKSAIKKLS
jgi:hypothetical protein